MEDISHFSWHCAVFLLQFFVLENILKECQGTDESTQESKDIQH